MSATELAKHVGTVKVKLSAKWARVTARRRSRAERRDTHVWLRRVVVDLDKWDCGSAPRRKSGSGAVRIRYEPLIRWIVTRARRSGALGVAPMRREFRKALGEGRWSSWGARAFSSVADTAIAFLGEEFRNGFSNARVAHLAIP